ncbi:hypothetical protein GGF46_001074 [Coemansia sp. RSA 552]|nr:hypothetical protein GGF46_001074 [Coemansia sp. RSA 552]
MTTRVPQRPAKLKAYVRVSKKGNGPIGKDDAKVTPRRMTRSQTAALYGAPVSRLEADAVPASEPSPESAPATPARKRKLSPAAEAGVESTPAKRAAKAPGKPQRATQTPRTRQRRAQTLDDAGPARRTTTRKTTINAYFSSATPKPEKQETADSLPRAVDPTTVEPLSVPEEVKPACDNSNATAATAADVDGAKAARAARANSVLKRLRSRKRPETTGSDGPAATIEETRAIQDAIRARRGQPVASPAASQTDTDTELPDTPASFEAASTASPEERAMRELKRQFVQINSRVGGNAPLPREFRKLEELFQGLEHAVLFGGQGGAGVVYHRIRKGVESMARRTFGWKELGQILALYPESYTIKPQQTMHGGRRVQSVVLTPVARGLDLAVEMEARRDEFKRRLLSRVTEAHKGFLTARGYSESDLVGVVGWHPSFDLESTPTISPIALPPSSIAARQATGAVAKFDREKLKHLLGTCRDKAPAMGEAPASEEAITEQLGSSATPEIKPAVLALPTPTDSPVLQSTDSNTGKPKERPTSSANALLERIRAKQRAKEQAAKTSVAEIPAHTRSMYSRLPGVLDAVSFLYYAERKGVLPFFYVAKKLGESKGLDKPEATSHLVSLAGFVPEWCCVDDSDPQDPSPDALLKVMRAISVQEAKKRLHAGISALGSS